MSYTLETHMKYNENLTYKHYMGKENENKDIQKCTGNYNQYAEEAALNLLYRGEGSLEIVLYVSSLISSWNKV